MFNKTALKAIFSSLNAFILTLFIVKYESIKQWRKALGDINFLRKIQASEVQRFAKPWPKLDFIEITDLCEFFFFFQVLGKIPGAK